MPGFDVGSFWAATGLASLVHSKTRGLYHNMPLGLGDITSASSLLAGIAGALCQKHATGHGSMVEVCLTHTGVWCVSLLSHIRTRAPHLLYLPAYILKTR